MRPARRSSRARAGVALEQGVLGLGVEGRRRLVEHEHERLVAHEAAGQGELLPLPEGDLDAVVPRRAELGVEPGRQAVDDVVGAGPVDGADHRRHVVEPRLVADADALAGDQLEAEEVLERPGQPGPPRPARDRREVDAVDGDAPGRRAVHPGQQLDERRLAGAVLADDRHDGAGRQQHVDVVEGEAFGARVAERHVLEADAVAQPVGRLGRGAAPPARRRSPRATSGAATSPATRRAGSRARRRTGRCTATAAARPRRRARCRRRCGRARGRPRRCRRRRPARTRPSRPTSTAPSASGWRRSAAASAPGRPGGGTAAWCRCR